jgi:hypothetical protein
MASETSGTTATLTVSGPFQSSGNVTYQAVFTNTSAFDSFDSGGHEFTATIPAGLTAQPNLSTASHGTVGFDPDEKSVFWDGDLLAGQSVTITFIATINAGASGTISVQGQAGFSNFDGGGNFIPTDDPALPGDADPTSFTVGALPVTLQTFSVD